MNEGWVCPRCGKVNAPDVKWCDCKNEPEPTPQRSDPRDGPAYYPDWIYSPYRSCRPIWFDWYTIC